jgi:hypothetical protein
MTYATEPKVRTDCAAVTYLGCSTRVVSSKVTNSFGRRIWEFGEICVTQASGLKGDPQTKGAQRKKMGGLGQSWNDLPLTGR